MPAAVQAIVHVLGDNAASCWWHMARFADITDIENHMYGDGVQTKPQFMTELLCSFRGLRNVQVLFDGLRAPWVDIESSDESAFSDEEDPWVLDSAEIVPRFCMADRRWNNDILTFLSALPELKRFEMWRSLVTLVPDWTPPILEDSSHSDLDRYSSKSLRWLMPEY